MRHLPLLAGLLIAASSCAKDVPRNQITKKASNGEENNSKIDSKTAEFCMKAQDFAGCVETMTRGLPPKQKQDAEAGLRTWTRPTGVVVRMRTSDVVAMKARGSYGRYIKWTYSRTGEIATAGWTKEVQGDCKEYTADWNQDGTGWLKLKDPSEYSRKSNEYEPVREAKAVMDEFCPQMDRLVAEAQKRDSLNPE